MDKTQSGSRSSLLGIFINILLPVLILDYCSAGPANPLERPSGESFWHIGPVWALVIALSLPLVYGIRSLVVTKKFDLMSGVGMAGVLLTGIIGTLQMFDQAYIFSNGSGGPANSTLTVSLMVYRYAFGTTNAMGYASTIAIVLALVIMAVSLIAEKLNDAEKWY